MASSSRGEYRVNTAGSPSQARQAKVYQIDFTAVASGKRIASSKRRVRWRFGFANPQALALGETGTACRGEEHDVTLVWSITSGKRLILADGQEVHYSSSRNSIFDFSWTMRGNHVLKVVAHASPPLAQTPGFRQYDFFVDGQSFFTFPKLYRLGMAGNDPRGSAPSSPTTGSPTQLAERGQRYSSYNGSERASARSSNAGGTNIVNLEAPNNHFEEEAYLQEAIRQSLQEDLPPEKTKASSSASAPTEGGANDLLDFASEPQGRPASSDAHPSHLMSTADPFGFQSAASAPVPALPPSTATNPYGPQSVAGAANPWAASQSMPSLPVTAASSLDTSNSGFRSSVPGLSVAPGSSGYGQQSALTLTQPLQQSSWALPAQVQATAPAPAGSWTVPAPISTQQLQYSGSPPLAYNGGGSSSYEQLVPPTITPQAQQTPSTIGFASPPSAFGGFASPAPQVQETAAAAAFAPEPALPTAATTNPATVDPALFTMNTLSSQYQQDPTDGSAPASSGSLVDQAYAKLVNMDNFSFVTKNDQPRTNPFEFSSSTSSSIGNQSLSNMKAQKASSGPAKPVMNTPVPAPGAMVVSSNQNGFYGSSYGVQPPVMQQQQQPFFNQQGQQPFGQPTYGQPPGQQQQPFQAPQQPLYGQPAQYGMPPSFNYGQAQPPGTF